MDEMTKIALEHYERYPKMVMRDFLKLVYQNTFGPKHFSDSPTLPDIEQCLETELNSFADSKYANTVEELGFGYVRVPLQTIKTHQFTLSQIARAFSFSMQEQEELPLSKLTAVFKDRVNLILHLVESGKIQLPIEECRSFVEAYFLQEIRPLSHSQIFRETYDPHYRVINKKYLLK